MKRQGEYSLFERFVFRFGFTFWFIFTEIAVTALAITEGIPKGYYSLKEIIISNIIFGICMVFFGTMNYCMGKDDEESNIARYQK